MPELLKHKNNDFNPELFGNLFNVYDLHSFESMYLLSHEYELPSFEKELKKDLIGKTKLVLIAADPDNYEKIDKYSPELIQYFKSLGVSDAKVIDHRVSTFAALKYIQNADVVFLMGGNQKRQMEFLKEYELDKLLETFKGIIIGRSAGAMNLGKVVLWSDDNYAEATKFSNYEGLGFCNLIIAPHFTLNDYIRPEKFLKTKLDIIGLPETSFIKIDKYGIQTFFGEYYIKENNKIVKIDN